MNPYIHSQVKNVCNTFSGNFMKYIGKHFNRKTYYLNLDGDYKSLIPANNWVCFMIANEKPDENKLDAFIRFSIEKNLSEFKAQGKFGDYLHNFFDETMVQMEVIENHTEINTMTTGNNDTDLPNTFWEAYGATCLPEDTDYDNIKIICVSFDKKDYSDELSELLIKFNNGWLPEDDN
jgi:hypothetical protein